MTVTFKLRCQECDVIVSEECEFAPDCPPKPCMNPDHPAYSDPGSPGYVEGYPETCPGCGVPIDPDYAYDCGLEEYIAQVEDARERAAEAKYDEWKDRDRD